MGFLASGLQWNDFGVGGVLRSRNDWHRVNASEVVQKREQKKKDKLK